MTDTATSSEIPAIRMGAEGDDVLDIQRRLSRLSVVTVAEDGWFGEQTRDAVRSFQRRRGLPADGVVGPETWHALVEAGHAFGDRLLWHSAVLMRGDDVLTLQRLLNQLGFDAGPEDGIFGRLTRAAVEEFQRNVGLAVDGVAGPATVEALRRLRRDHQSPGVGARVREREALRRMIPRGLPGAGILLDPAYGPTQPGLVDPRASEVTWDIASRVSGRLAASGADVFLSRGPATTPSGGERARLANELGIDVVLSIGVNAHPNPQAQGASSYYFGSERFVSEVGRRLADLVQATVIDAGWGPDCRTHPMTWALLRETRMTSVVVEPGFITSPVDAERLTDAAEQDALAGTLVDALAGFLAGHAVADVAPAHACQRG